MKKPNQPVRQSFISSDRAILLLCISIAFFFWLLVKFSQDFTTTHQVKVNYQLPQDRSFLNKPPEVIIATINGNGWDLLSSYFLKNHTQISFELPEETSFTISSSMLKNKVQHELKQVTVQEINYDYILLQAEPLSEKKVPIRLIHQITWHPQYQIIDSFIFAPDSVLLIGPAPLIDTVFSWPSTALVYTQQRSDINTQLDLLKPDNQQIKLNPTSINVTAEVEQVTEKKLFIPVTLLNAPDSSRIFPNKIQISATVGLSKFDQLKASDFKLEANLSNIPLNNPNNTIPLQLTLAPDYLKHVKLNKESVEFYYIKEAELE